jgi:hypothetical protein
MILHLQKFLKKLSESLLAVIKVVILSRYARGIEKSVQEKECVILGNGPSFNTLYTDYKGFLEGRDLICVNMFPATSLYEVLKPSMFITSAPEFWLDGMDAVYETERKKLFNALAEKTRWPLKLFIPFSARKSKEWQMKIATNPEIKVIYYNDTGVEGWKTLIYWLFRKNLAMPRPHNVLSPAIFNAISQGYKTIWLWGADHNQFLELSVDEDNIAMISHRHFYDFSSATPDVMRKMGTGRRKVHEILHKFMLTFEAYHVLRDYAEKNGVKIYNPSPGSLIDAFERKKI